MQKNVSTEIGDGYADIARTDIAFLHFDLLVRKLVKFMKNLERTITNALKENFEQIIKEKRKLAKRKFELLNYLKERHTGMTSMRLQKWDGIDACSKRGDCNSFDEVLKTDSLYKL
ncbi:hypothetical protein TNCT_339001 [Trichonephila clavata]|uniref:Uncharacterized protein n=1 Tax=Trichonephila clavata TaxID=2740835 RepID=A0A8X6K9M3_TRICU|nr:hypothetical protein TNCT_339001 [Trichonephila clavata]